MQQVPFTFLCEGIIWTTFRIIVFRMTLLSLESSHCHVPPSCTHCISNSWFQLNPVLQILECAHENPRGCRSVYHYHCIFLSQQWSRLWNSSGSLWLGRLKTHAILSKQDSYTLCGNCKMLWMWGTLWHLDCVVNSKWFECKVYIVIHIVRSNLKCFECKAWFGLHLKSYPRRAKLWVWSFFEKSFY